MLTGRSMRNFYVQAVKSKKGFVLFHGAHDPREAFRRLRIAIERRLSFEVDINVVEREDEILLVNAHSPLSYPKGRIPVEDLRDIHPLRYLRELRGREIPVKIDLKTPKLLKYPELLKLIVSVIPREMRIGSVFLWELTFQDASLKEWQREENFTLEELLELKELLEAIPFVASARGLTVGSLKDSSLKRYIGELLRGRTEVINLNLSVTLEMAKELWMEMIRPLWEVYGIINELWVNNPELLQLYMELSLSSEVPFLGLTDDEALATSC